MVTALFVRGTDIAGSSLSKTSRQGLAAALVAGATINASRVIVIVRADVIVLVGVIGFSEKL